MKTNEKDRRRMKERRRKSKHRRRMGRRRLEKEKKRRGMHRTAPEEGVPQHLATAEEETRLPPPPHFIDAFAAPLQTPPSSTAPKGRRRICDPSPRRRDKRDSPDTSPPSNAS